ncbi:MAG: 6-bladed beta-propeller [Gemmatimonadota bacterium]|nr:6-bladed beta-propeller [Gemmatimonadota bacterium]
MAVACGRDSPASRGNLTTTIDTINGIVHVTNTGDPPEWQLTQVVSIGPQSITETGSANEFGGVRSVALGPEDALYIADLVNREVRVFGLDGAHRRTFGREGEGPGEFAGLHSIAWVGDRLLALDYVMGRVTEFSAEGDALGERRMRGRIGGSPLRFRFFQVGPDEAYAMTYVVDETRRGLMFAGHDSQGETGDTLPLLRSEQPSGIDCEYNEGWVTFFDIPFAPSLVQHPGPGGVMYTAKGNDYRIAVIRGSDTLRVIERALSAEPVSDEEWETGNQEFRDFIAETPGAECDPRRPTRPEAKPFIEDIYIAPDGKLWVEVLRTAGNRWEIFDTGGRLLGTFPVRPRKEDAAPVFGPDQLVTIRRDSLDLDHVDVWRIDRAGR